MPAEPDPVDTLTRTLVRACRALAEAGQPGIAGRLAADGWVAVRDAHPRQAQHLDGAMHHIARLEQQLERDAGESAAGDEAVLDVRSEVPKRRHELIFAAFGNLAAGTSYVLVNDHDPAPLRYQFDAELPGQASWDYLEAGPEVWRVRIGRTAP